MITTFVVLCIAVAAVWYIVEKSKKKLDANNDGKIDAADVKAVADVNKDGKVNAVDAKVAVEQVVAEVKEAVVEAPKPVQVNPPTPVEVEAPKPVEKPKKTAARKTAAAPRKEDNEEG
jgi:hypothetical protein